jgi:hypothetical protein
MRDVSEAFVVILITGGERGRETLGRPLRLFCHQDASMIAAGYRVSASDGIASCADLRLRHMCLHGLSRSPTTQHFIHTCLSGLLCRPAISFSLAGDSGRASAVYIRPSSCSLAHALHIHSTIFFRCLAKHPKYLDPGRVLRFYRDHPDVTHSALDEVAFAWGGIVPSSLTPKR